MKKKMYTYVFGYFPNSMCEKKKMYICIFWVIFQQLKRKKKILLNKRSRNGWATAQLYCEKKKFCIATLGLYCKRRLVGLELY